MHRNTVRTERELEEKERELEEKEESGRGKSLKADAVWLGKSLKMEKIRQEG